MATPPAYKAKASAYFSTTGATKVLTIPAGVVVGDLMLLQWVGGTALATPPSGWAQVVTNNDGVELTVFRRFAQAGDAGSTVTIDAPTTAKSFMTLLVYSGVSTATPIAGFTSAVEATSQTTHATGSIAAMPADARVVQFLGMKDGATSSSARTVPSGNTQRENLDSAAGTFGFVSMASERTAATTAGTIASVNWGSDQASATAVMITIVIAPTTSVVGVGPTADVTVPSGSSNVGGTTMHDVQADDDPNTYTLVPVTGVPVTSSLKFGPLSSPLTAVTRKVILEAGTSSVIIIPSLRRGATTIATYSAQTLTGTGEQSYTINIGSGDQTAQATDLTDIRWFESITGS